MIAGHTLLLGAMKAGTTALYRLLCQHPALCECSEKEPAFFAQPANRAKGLDWYRGLWDWRPEHRWAIEASTSYTKAPTHLGAAPFLGQLGTEVRLIYVVRDPIQRIRSHYLHSLAAGWMKRSLADGIAPGPLFYSNYHYQLLPYETWQGPEQLLVLQYERFCADPIGVARECCRFLEIDADFAFAPPGIHNGGDDYRVRLLAQGALDRGLLANVPDGLTARGTKAENFLRWVEAELGGADAAERTETLRREVEATFTPTAAQIDWIHERIGDDLERFEARWGIDPWARKPASLLTPSD